MVSVWRISDFSITPDDGHVVYRTGFVSGALAEVLFSVPLDTDGDGDDVLDSVDCDSGDASIWSVPGETPNLTLASQPGAPTVTELNWSEPDETGTSEPVLYDVLRSDTPFVSGFGITCVASAQTATTTEDADVPDDVFFYLVRAENACGVGGLGANSNGQERVITGTPCGP